MGTYAPQLDAFLRRLTSRHRVLLLGGLAVIAHGLSRATKDADVWLEPMTSASEWAEALAAVAAEFPNVRFVRLPGWRSVPTRAEIAAAVEETRMVRVLGLECPLDVFREPNEIEAGSFDLMWAQSTPKDDGVHLPAPVDLILSKENTGRESDQRDIFFLESVIRADLGGRLAGASLEEARGILARYCDYVVCERALANPDPGVRTLARERLTEMAEQGDWFSRDVLARSAGG